MKIDFRRIQKAHAAQVGTAHLEPLVIPSPSPRVNLRTFDSASRCTTSILFDSMTFHEYGEMKKREHQRLMVAFHGR